MRINRFIALNTGLSRRAADKAVADGRVTINGVSSTIGAPVNPDDKVLLDNRTITPAVNTTIILNKPVGYVCSRDGQGSKTVYDLLPPGLHNLKPVGRLDKNSSGLLLLTNDGDLANRLTHPRYQKEKVYEVEIDQPLRKTDFEKITQGGVDIGDNHLSQFQLESGIRNQEASRNHDSYFVIHTSVWLATLHEGRNRQIRRTFTALGYKVISLKRTNFGNYKLDALQAAKWQVVHKSISLNLRLRS